MVTSALEASQNLPILHYSHIILSISFYVPVYTFCMFSIRFKANFNPPLIGDDEFYTYNIIILENFFLNRYSAFPVFVIGFKHLKSQ